MNKKLFVVLGFVLIAVIGFIIFSKQKNAHVNIPFFAKKTIAVGQDICAEFPKEWVSSVLKKPIIRTNKFEMKGTYTCNYYTDENNSVMLGLNDLSFETQKRGQQELGRIISTNDKIPLNHFIATQENNVINDIVLEITPNQFLAIARTTAKTISETDVVDFAIQVAQRIKNGENQGLGSTSSIINEISPTKELTKEPTKKPESSGAPLPQDKDVVNNFFTFINTGKASDAVMMMSTKTTSDDGAKQGYGVQFAAMKSVLVKKIVESSKSDWSDTWHQYMVTFDVSMDPSSANGPIPYFGYENGENIRFITLVKEGNQWKIEGLSTGP